MKKMYLFGSLLILPSCISFAPVPTKQKLVFAVSVPEKALAHVTIAKSTNPHTFAIKNSLTEDIVLSRVHLAYEYSMKDEVTTQISLQKDNVKLFEMPAANGTWTMNVDFAPLNIPQQSTALLSWKFETQGKSTVQFQMSDMLKKITCTGVMSKKEYVPLLSM